MSAEKIKILEVLRIVNPILMFSIILFGLWHIVEIPLVLALPVACLSAIIAFTVISKVLSIERNKS